jgi:hypothetical protein
MNAAIVLLGASFRHVAQGDIALHSRAIAFRRIAVPAATRSEKCHDLTRTNE